MRSRTGRGKSDTRIEGKTTVKAARRVGTENIAGKKRGGAPGAIARVKKGGVHE